jgi:uncharacterized protein
MLMVKTFLKYSNIHGLGCFANEDIKQGTVVWRFDEGIDLVFTESQLSSFPESFRDFLKIYAYSPKADKEKIFILCTDHARHMNHSDNPSLTETPEGMNVALRDIKKGEELTCNYFEFDKEAFHKLNLEA